MADNLQITQGVGTSVATDEVAGAHMQIIKIGIGPDGTATLLQFGTALTAASLPVVLASDHPAVKTKPVTSAHESSPVVARPNNTTAYAAGDVVGGAFQFSNMGVSGESAMITGARLELDIAAIPSGMTSFKMALYNATPPSAIADNAAFDFAVADRSVFLGIIDVGTPVRWGNTCYVETNNINKQVKLATTSIFAYLITSGPYTPAAVSENYKPTLLSLEL